MKFRNCVRCFRLGKTLYRTTSEVVFPIVIKVENDDFIRQEITASIIDSEGITFLCGKRH